MGYKVREAIVVLQKPLDTNYVTTLTKYGVGLFNTSGKGFQSNIIEGIKRETKDVHSSAHCTVKPLELMEKLVKLTCPINPGNIVLDPFMGTGTTLVAAKHLGLGFVGIEINRDYIEIAKRRLKSS